MSTPEPRQDSHCAYCGTALPADEGRARRCVRCGRTSYRNPLPVAVALLPVRAPDGRPPADGGPAGGGFPHDAPADGRLPDGERGGSPHGEPGGGPGCGPHDGRTGLVVVRRAVEPRRGLLALPGGFVDDREDWRHAVVRELHEETGIEATSDEVRLADVLSSPDGHLLVFGLLPARAAEDLPPAVPTRETMDRDVLYEPAELAFPLHTRVSRGWFEGRYGPAR